MCRFQKRRQLLYVLRMLYVEEGETVLRENQVLTWMRTTKAQVRTARLQVWGMRHGPVYRMIGEKYRSNENVDEKEWKWCKRRTRREDASNSGRGRAGRWGEGRTMPTRCSGPVSRNRRKRERGGPKKGHNAHAAHSVSSSHEWWSALAPTHQQVKMRGARLEKWKWQCTQPPANRVESNAISRADAHAHRRAESSQKHTMQPQSRAQRGARYKRLRGGAGGSRAARQVT